MFKARDKQRELNNLFTVVVVALVRDVFKRQPKRENRSVITWTFLRI
ncbi:hypothetical protein Z949_2061 [Sulfitobacter guttiformis KCTC 32187]|nr:hypothetical protein Z949_2061 [Sulfitobacter guttiformis KCTC 32187]